MNRIRIEGRHGIKERKKKKEERKKKKEKEEGKEEDIDDGKVYWI